MGDINAAAWCADAHTKVLRAKGSFPLHCALLNGRPPPRGGVLEALAIDDHFGCAVDSPGSTINADCLRASFDAAQQAYVDAGLSRSEKKARRDVDAGVFLGAEFVHDSHLLGSERLRRCHLAQATLELVRGRRASRAFLRWLLASWVHVLLYRRPMLRLMSAGFSFVGQVGDYEDIVDELPNSVIMELKRLSVLAPWRYLVLRGYC